MGRYGLPDSNITKKALAAALKSLMQTQAFEKISVGENLRDVRAQPQELLLSFQG